MGTDVCLRCIALCGAAGLGETELLEKWARDAKILDIFEGTQQIQLLIIARQLLKKTSAELKMNVTGTDFVLIHSQDLDRTERFYGDVLGLELGPRWGDIGFEVETGDTTLGVHRRRPGWAASSLRR